MPPSGTRSWGRRGPARLGEIEAERIRVLCFRRGGVVEQPLLPRVGLDHPDSRLVTTREPEIAKGLRVDRENAARGAVLGGHVRDRGAVGDGQRREPRSVEFHELPDDPFLPEQFGHGEHEVGGRGPLAKRAAQAEADHLGHEHGDRLAEHRSLRLDAADAPAEHAEPVDHGRVGVGADQRVGVRRVRTALAREDDARQELEVHLMDDAGGGRHDPKVLERALSPP